MTRMMEKTKHSLIRIERMDGETACLSLTGDDPEELLAMLGDGLAFWIYDHPERYGVARKFFRRVFRDCMFMPTVRYWRPHWLWTLIGAVVLIAAVYGLSYVFHCLGVG